MTNSIRLIAMVVLNLCLVATLSAQDNNPALEHIAFGSCAHEQIPQPIWSVINARKPQLFLFLGDNIYGDTKDMAVLKQKYQKLAEKPGFQSLIANSSIMATWDDHDYGENDAGSEYPEKEASRRIMLDFWNEPDDSPRRKQKGGIYTSSIFGPKGKKVQIILLDLRWNRSPLKAVSREVYEQDKVPLNMGPYLANEDENAQLLGEEQWLWLENTLKNDVALNIIGSSIQAIPEFTGWESWANFPKDRTRLLNLVDQYAAGKTLLVSGDTHWSEISEVKLESGQALYEMTSSGLTQEWKHVSPNQHRLGKPYVGPNFGEIDILWDRSPVQVQFRIRDIKGHIQNQQSLKLK